MEGWVFDYVIVGGGTAGCVLAARLSEDAGVHVCLLEAGPEDSHPLIHVPMGAQWTTRSKALNWRFHTRNERGLDDRQLFWPRGRTLGGSSSTHAMSYMRGHPSDYDAWARLGNFGWTFRDVLPYFKRAQNQERGASAFHGVGGPLNVADLRDPNVLSRTFVQAGIQAGIPFNDDFNSDVQEGVGLYQVTQKNGRRWSTSRAYLRRARRRSNLKVITGAHVRRVLFDGTAAVGVEYRRKGCVRTLRASREVILAAGAIQSPQLLMLSGVGDADELRAARVPLIEHVPGVGKNLQDPLEVIVAHSCTQRVSSSCTWRTVLRGGWDLARYLAAGKGMYTAPGAEGCGFAKSSPQEPVPDLQFQFTPSRVADRGHGSGFAWGDGYSLHVCNLRPKSRGEVRLAGNDPSTPPDIHANYLSHPDDLERLVKGVKLARDILEAPAFDRYRGEDLRPGRACRSDEDIQDFIRRHAETAHQPVGTCKMGTDDMAVVDSQLRVHGLQRLRVVDASIMPLLIGGNPNAPVVMIAEKASDLIKQARNPRARYPVSASAMLMRERASDTALRA